jgi:hypothetical protein
MNRRTSSQQIQCIAGLVFAAITCPVPAQVSAQTAAGRPHYRRVFVPAESLENHIRGLLPIKRDEFETLLAESTAISEPQVPRIESMIWRARFDGHDLRDGLAELNVRSATPAPLVLDPCNAAIQSAAWSDGKPGPALLGTDPNGNLVCLAAQSGKLQLTFSCPPSQVSKDAAIFDVRLPPTPQCRLEIETTAEYELTAGAGVVAAHESRSGSSNRRTSVIELGGIGQSRIVIRKRGARFEESPPLIIVREVAKYAVLGPTLDLDLALMLDVPDKPLTQLQLIADSALEVSSLRWKSPRTERELPVVRQVGENGGKTSYLIDLPEPSAGPGYVLQLTAAADWDPSRSLVLPRVAVDGATFQQGRVVVTAPSWLHLQPQAVADCIQTGVVAGPAPRSVDQFQFDLFGKAPAIAIHVGQSPGQLHELSGTQIRVDEKQITAVMIAELSSTGADRYALEALLPRTWIVDTVETQPSDLLADRWTTNRSATRQAMKIQLARSLNEQQPARILIRAHYRRPANEQPLGADFFHVATFPEAITGRRLVSVDVVDPAAQLALNGDDNLVRLDPKRLSAADLRLFETPPADLIFDSGSSSQDLSGRLVPTVARFQSEVLIQVLASRQELRQSVSIHCRPETSGISSLLVQVVPPPPENVVWRLSGGDPREVKVTRLPDQQLAPPLNEAMYRLTLPRPRSSPFELTASWSDARVVGNRIALVRVLEANPSSGLVEVHSQDGSEFVITARDMQQLPAPPGLEDQFTTLRARYQYRGREPSLRLEPARDKDAHSAAWVESLHLTSRYSVEGQSQHEARLAIENTALGELELRLPSGAEDVRFQEEGTSVEVALNITTDGEVIVPLPKGRRTVVLHLRYSTTDQALGWWPIGRFVTPIPQLQVPVLSRRWSVHFPPGFSTSAGLPASAVQGRDSHQAAMANSAQSPSRPRWDWPTFVQAIQGPAIITRLRFLNPPTSASPIDGWTVRELELPPAANGTVTIYRTTVLDVWCLSIALAALGIGLILHRSSVAILALATVCGAIALFVDGPWTWLVGSAAIGLFLAAISRLAQPLASGPRNVQLPAPLSTQALAIPTSAVVAIGALLLIPRQTLSAPVGEPAQPSVSYTTVVIPVDADQKPVGDYVYLRPDVYAALQRSRSARPDSLRPSFLIQGARYQFPTAPRLEKAVPAIDELTVDFDVTTLRNDSTVELPFCKDELFLLEGRARLDGQPIRLEWRDDGRLLLLTVPKTGQHRLELALAGRAKISQDRVVLDFGAPPAPRSVVVLPPGARLGGEQSKELASDEDAISDSPREISVGPVRRFVVEWPRTSTKTRSAASPEAEQFLWWHLQPDSVVVEGRFRLRSMASGPQETVVAVDPRLRLIPASMPGRTIHVESGTENLVHVEWNEPAGADVDIRLSWSWTDASGGGAFVLPRIALRADTLARSWIAVSAHPSLRVQWPNSVPIGTPSAADFMEAWRDAMAPPNAVLQWSPVARRLELVSTPSVGQPNADQIVEWSLSSVSATANVSIRLQNVPASRLSYRLKAPPQAKVSDVTVSQSGRAAELRWSHEREGGVLITLLEPPAIEQLLTVSLELPQGVRQTRLPLPLIRLDDVGQVRDELRIHRQSDVLLRLQSSAGWKSERDPGIGRYREPFGRLVAVLRQDPKGPDRPPVLTRTPNKPEVSGQMFIRAHEDDGDWRTEMDLQLQVKAGVLDQLRLAAPPQLQDPLEIEPVFAQRLAGAASHREVILKLEESVNDRLHLTVRGLLASAGGVRAPDVNVIGSPDVERYFLLDSKWGADHIDWQTVGLQPVDSPPAELPAAWPTAGSALFRAVGAPISALARLERSAQAESRVLFADISLSLLAEQRFSALATYTIVSSGNGEIQLELPPGCRLVQVLSDGVPAQSAQIGARVWRVIAPSASLPHRLSVVYDGVVSRSNDGGELRLPAPRLTGMTVQKSVWSVRATTAELDPAFGGLPPAPATPIEIELARLQAAVRALEEVAAAQGNDVPAAMMTEEMQRWRQEYLSLKRRVSQLLQKPDNHPAAWSELLVAAQEEVAKIEQRFPAAFAGAASDAEQQANQAGSRADEEATTWLAIGPTEALSLELTSPRHGFDVERETAVAVFVALSLFSVIVARSSAARDWLAAHSHFVLAAAGLAWWAIAPAGWLGWPIILIGLTLALLWPWRRHGRASDSTIRRSWATAD